MLLWPAVKVRPDILFAVCFLGRFASNAGKQQIDWAKGVIRYLAGTKTWGLGYQRTKDKPIIQGASDADLSLIHISVPTRPAELSYAVYTLQQTTENVLDLVCLLSL